MNKTLIKILALALTALIVGCSNQWREGDPQISADEIQGMLSQSTEYSLFDNAASRVVELSEMDQSLVFFADGPSPLGPVISVASVYNFDFLGTAGADIGFDNISEIQVFFVDVLDNGHQSGLLLNIKTTGQESFRTFAFTGVGSMSDNKFTVQLDNNGNGLVLETNDVTDGEFNDVIQMKIYDLNGNYNGKFSTLIGVN